MIWLTNETFRRAVTMVAVLLLGCFTYQAAAAQPAPTVRAPQNHPGAKWPQALRIADFILSLQNAAGAIPDQPDVITVNEDSNMEYALIALGAAYAASKDVRYRDGLERGIRWLAAREEMGDLRWKGSWWYVYSANPPYQPIPASPGDGVTDVRGVDATSALFVYLLYLDQRLTGNDALAKTYAPNAHAALDFVIHHDLDRDGFSRSSWQRHASDEHWYMFAFKYSADQGDVYLGMHAGALLYHVEEYERIARILRESTRRQLFVRAKGRYGLGINEKGVFDPSPYIFAQGYLAWMWGDTPQNRQALEWLRSNVESDGALVEAKGKPAESLSVAMLGMAAAALHAPQPRKSFEWLVTNSFDPATGGVHDKEDPKTPEYNNVAGFCAISLLGFLPFD